ncbi:MAG: T9SS type A sorting domain-containing protein [Bacteroidales bacterium]|nr:T9SS type A sorting domain-containing protein [Bacteroidales bacterium]MDY0198740.1 T9SS type A sorting domain-containing protein [Tenuifilaceae bacterium]
MKKIFTLMFVLAGFFAQAQFSTPGTGVNWNLDALVSNSEGAVIWNVDHYEITTTLTILPADSITILDDVTVLFHQLAGIESEGTLLIDAPIEAIFSSIDTTLTTDRWRGFKLLENHVTHIKNAKFLFGGGLRVQSGTFTIDGSTFYKNFYKSGSSDGSYTSNAALDISGNAEITNCNFTHNQRGAISSASNMDCRAIIRNNYFFGNTTENSNRPQINMGPSGVSDTTYIVGNTIIGDGNTRAGGIAYSSLLGNAGNVVIDSNIVDQNRYGITLTGSPINGAIRYNTVTNNNIENNPALGGSGLNFTASSESSNQQVVVTGNIISGNLWGITIIGYPQVNMGDSAAATFNPGGNVFSGNGNEGVLYDLYNNGPVNQTAMYNCWGVETQDSTSIETVVVHVVDDPTLGRVDFMPSCAFQTTFIVQDDAETLLSGVEIEIESQEQSLITNANGEASAMLPPNTYNFTATLVGYGVYTGSVTVAYGINIVNIVLETEAPTLYTVTFIVDSNVGSLADVEIQINEEIIVTNENGIATIELTDGEYPYVVTAPEYDAVEGTVTVNGEAVEVPILLGTGIYNPLASSLRVYPNPVIDRLILEGAKVDAAKVYSITGQLLLQIEQVNGIIDLSGLNKGVYLIWVKSQNLETTIRVVKE